MTRTRSRGDRSVPCALRHGPPDVCEHGRVHSARRTQRIARTSRIPPPQDASFERRAPQSIAHQPLRSRVRSTTFACRHLAAGRPPAQDGTPRPSSPAAPETAERARTTVPSRALAHSTRSAHTAPPAGRFWVNFGRVRGRARENRTYLGQFAAAERGIRTAGAPERFTRAPALARDFYEFEFSPYGGEMAESGAMHRMRVPAGRRQPSPFSAIARRAQTTV
ncbi:uncharacterized protein TRAVEDRAFT_32527 [Trametes versicolor FP-101664 SS1]|uniref:Uncharacterized protein n=1 Tax=Trametes versicolor (strain FP-101664) TaxID=717944 RepID=R7S687_TRAVS|nr:uncharacterized protein TRAVEDRAFT_32527 [Trametes versicolor FP-101664 SS1]EIW51311.1 hypothetical protein TRAVEDRAFT_32527 [Trametes versicolor FP-101664 SS1]